MSEMDFDVEVGRTFQKSSVKVRTMNMPFLVSINIVGIEALKQNTQLLVKSEQFSRDMSHQ